MPRENAEQIERSMDFGFQSQQPLNNELMASHAGGSQAPGQSSTQYDGIFFDQRSMGGLSSPTQQPFMQNSNMGMGQPG